MPRCPARDARVGTFCQLALEHDGDHRFSTPHLPHELVEPADPPPASDEARAYYRYRSATAKLHATELQHEADKLAWREALAALNRTLVEG
jgi:hypothetical protein